MEKLAPVTILGSRSGGPADSSDAPAAEAPATNEYWERVQALRAELAALRAG